MRNKVIIWISLTLLVLGCDYVLESVPANDLETEIPANPPGEPVAQAPEPTPTPQPTPTLTPTPAPTPTPTVTPFFLKGLSLTPPECVGLSEYECRSQPPPAGLPPRHGLIIAVLLPALALGIPWLVAEIFTVRYVQPRSIDLSQVLIKAQDGMFVQAAVSLTARRSLSLASTRMSWPRVREFVEKSLEQELLHDALNFPTLEDLERNLKNIAESFKALPIVEELYNDFGVEVMWFNIETRYPPETMDALNRRAEAAAGGTAYLAYAAAARLDPDSQESRELYRVYQETKGQVDAARNLGGGFTSIANLLRQRKRQEEGPDEPNG